MATINGTPANDVLRSLAGADTIDGGAGIDTADYTDSTAAVFVTLNNDPARTTRGSGGYAAGDVLSGMESLTGSSFDDLLGGNGLDNQLIGLLGKDTYARLPEERNPQAFENVRGLRAQVLGAGSRH